MLSQVMAEGVAKALQRLTGEPYAREDVAIEQPASVEHGDYSTNAAMKLAKTLRQPPIRIAEQLKAALEEEGLAGGLIRRIEVVPPGFMNLFLDWGEWAKRSFSLPPAAPGKTVVEHTSINPNKSAHIGHLRNSCIGDTIVRMLRRMGSQAEVHNYIDDLGNQLADTVVGLLHVPLTASHDRFGDYCWELYSLTNKQYESNPELAAKRADVLHALEEGNSAVSWIGLLAAERIVREHVEEMQQFGIAYDLLVWESNIVREGFWATAFELLQRSPLFVRVTEGKLAGCWVLKQTAEETGETEHHADKVLVRSNGILTYTAKDIAYHLWKFGLFDNDFSYRKMFGSLWTTSGNGTKAEFGKADRVINVIDVRQEYPQAMVKQALRALGFEAQAEQLHHVNYGVVSLSPASARELGVDTSDGKGSYAMSGRQGIGIKISELLDLMERRIEQARSDHEGLSSREIAAASIRYYLLRFNMHTEVVFDLQQATELSGNTGVYLLYSCVRASSVLQKAQQVPAPESIGTLAKAEYALLRHISLWEDTLYTACRELTPNAICTYAYELSTLFNNFYASCPILKAEDGQRELRIWLTAKFRETLGDALQVLGLPTPERM